MFRLVVKVKRNIRHAVASRRQILEFFFLRRDATVLGESRQPCAIFQFLFFFFGQVDNKKPDPKNHPILRSNIFFYVKLFAKTILS